MSKSFEKLQPFLDKAMALQTAMMLFEWDNETQAPPQSGSYTTKVIGILSGEYFRIVTGDDMKRLLNECKDDRSLTLVETGIVREMSEELEKLECIPREEYQDFATLTAESTRVWADAKKKASFQDFAPTLKKVLDYQKKFASYRAKDGEKLYNVMLDSYEKGFDMECLDRFFAELKAAIVPLLRRIKDKRQLDEYTFLTGNYPAEKQEKLARFLAEYVGFDFEKGVMAVSAHPFTTNLHNHDVRLTTHYTDKVDDSIFSVIHEAGHGLYELGISNELTQTPLGQGASMGMHESQSRFFENILGRSEAFWKPVYPKVQQMFPDQLKEISLEQWVRAVNQVNPGLIRIQADELTYSLHIMIRYEIEKMLVEEDLDVDQLPAVWADKYEEYLGVRPQQHDKGVLQDIHWSQGSFGYFPSYALGSAFGAQMYEVMKHTMKVEQLLEAGDLGPIRDYLKEHIHKFGKLKDSRKLLRDMTGEDFDPKYYIKYLTNKYEKLYDLN